MTGGVYVCQFSFRGNNELSHSAQCSNGTSNWPVLAFEETHVHMHLAGGTFRCEMATPSTAEVEGVLVVDVLM